MKMLLHTPEGVRDIYNKECENKLYLQEQIHKVMKLYGYSDIQTPSFEFFDVFGKDKGSTPSKNMYKFFDREGNTLVLRPDVTPSIARAVAKYFTREDMPIRFCYMGNTFVNNAEHQGKLKEITQTGAELIGDNRSDADVEAIALVINALLKCGLSEFQIEIGHAGIIMRKGRRSLRSFWKIKTSLVWRPSLMTIIQTRLQSCLYQSCAAIPAP